MVSQVQRALTRVYGVEQIEQLCGSDQYDPVVALAVKAMDPNLDPKTQAKLHLAVARHWHPVLAAIQLAPEDDETTETKQVLVEKLMSLSAKARVLEHDDIKAAMPGLTGPKLVHDSTIGEVAPKIEVLEVDKPPPGTA